ncbi:MAG: hypothetical protein WBG46_08395 [Nonlabens sp.]
MKVVKLKDMTIQDALLKINELRKEDFNASSLKVLERWNQTLYELQGFQLSHSEEQQIESELDVHIYKVLENPTRRNLKKTLEGFLSFLDQNLKIKSGNKILFYGLLLGAILALITSLSILKGLLIGFAAGLCGIYYVRSRYRYLKTNLEDLW